MPTGNRRASAFANAIATWFGCGLSPFAPGTFGSLGALVPAILLVRYAGWRPWYFAVLAVALTPLGIWAAGRRAIELGKEDPGSVVVDEVIGQWIALAGAASLHWAGWIAAFALFRTFDIWKPPPVRQLERLHGGLGIVADDVMAGIYGALVLYAAGCFNLY
jgi:phosphatidylglycerophosphatase A